MNDSTNSKITNLCWAKQNNYMALRKKRSISEASQARPKQRGLAQRRCRHLVTCSNRFTQPVKG